jgi:hypothetical protein
VKCGEGGRRKRCVKKGSEILGMKRRRANHEDKD